MQLSTQIVVSFQWTGTHYWPDAEGKHEYLKHPHRHVFKSRAWIEVYHDDRELEYFAVLDKLNAFVEKNWALGSRSCEMMATDILRFLQQEYGADRSVKVEVMEDGENGSVVKWGMQ